ncbi:MAG: hypothetical protein ABIJ96_08910 [Elusimicrobiota bacterium]
MKTKFIRFLVVAFCTSTLGGLALTPNVSYGATEQETQEHMAAEKLKTQQAIAAQQDYNSGYNEGYMRAREEEQKKLDEQAYNQNSGCCGGGQQQQQTQ